VKAADLMQAGVGAECEVALLTGGKDRPYAFGLTAALLSNGARVDLIAGDDLTSRDFDSVGTLKVFSLRKEPRPDAGVLTKASGVLLYYGRLVRYALTAQPRIFHILWNNKFDAIDRVFLMLYYRLLGKRIVLTAHNVNAGKRDATDSLLNRLTLRLQYLLSDHIFVHTDKMKSELVDGFGVRQTAVSVIAFGINNDVPQTALTPSEAKARLGIAAGEKTILFFGNIAPYKGLEYLLSAFRQVAARGDGYRLIVAGRPKQGSETYWKTIRGMVDDQPEGGRITLRIEFVPDDETELYFKAADVLVLPYTSIFQSGVLFLGYSFGLPVLAADVGSLKDDIVEGQTGFVFPARDSAALAKAIEAYFASDLFKALDQRRRVIHEYANAKYSWEAIADVTRKVYGDLLFRPLAPRDATAPVRG
jgi:glycosyltransferase involved in cell wall biosynthesis